MSKLPAINPCPFCGGKRRLISRMSGLQAGYQVSVRREYFVKCIGCGAYGATRKTVIGAIRTFNVRPLEWKKHQSNAEAWHETVKLDESRNALLLAQVRAALEFVKQAFRLGVGMEFQELRSQAIKLGIKPAKQTKD